MGDDPFCNTLFFQHKKFTIKSEFPYNGMSHFIKISNMNK